MTLSHSGHIRLAYYNLCVDCGDESMHSVLLVCTANLCRSPLACEIMRKMIREQADVHEWRIESAGTWAREGQTAAHLAQVVAQENGFDLSAHRSRCVSRELLDSFNLVLTMEQGHKEALGIEFPDIAQKVYTLAEMAGVMASVGDPLHGTLVDYRQAYREIDQWLYLGYKMIIDLA